MKRLKNRIAPFLGLLVIFAACDSGVVVKGKVRYPQFGQITITEIRQDEQKPVEQTMSLGSDSTFRFNMKLREPGFYKINFFNRQVVSVVVDKSNIEVNVDGNGPAGAVEIIGSPDTELEKAIQKTMEEAQNSDAAKVIATEFQAAASENNIEKITAVQERYKTEILDKALDQIADKIRQMPPSLGVINLLQNRGVLDPNQYLSVYQEVAAKSLKQWPENFYAKGFNEFVIRLQKTAVGQPAPEISLPDPQGKIMTLSSMKGKYILIDFWAKWCGPCRAENPNVVKVYNEFKDKGFDILSVSLDRSREDWVQAIAEDGLLWNQVSDLKYFQSQAALDYNINSIPFSVLVDPKGVIVAKNLRGPGLQKKLREVLP